MRKIERADPYCPIHEMTPNLQRVAILALGAQEPCRAIRRPVQVAAGGRDHGAHGNLPHLRKRRRRHRRQPSMPMIRPWISSLLGTHRARVTMAAVTMCQQWPLLLHRDGEGGRQAHMVHMISGRHCGCFAPHSRRSMMSLQAGATMNETSSLLSARSATVTCWIPGAFSVSSDLWARAHLSL